MNPQVEVGQVWVYQRSTAGDGTEPPGPVVHVITEAHGDECYSTSVFEDGTSQKCTLAGPGCGGAGMKHMREGRDGVGTWTFLGISKAPSFPARPPPPRRTVWERLDNGELGESRATSPLHGVYLDCRTIQALAVQNRYEGDWSGVYDRAGQAAATLARHGPFTLELCSALNREAGL
jgi:hypothetical protein